MAAGSYFIYDKGLALALIHKLIETNLIFDVNHFGHHRFVFHAEGDSGSQLENIISEIMESGSRRSAYHIV